MKKSFILLLLSLFLVSLAANAVEIKIEGKGYAPLTGYNIKYVRNQQNTKMNKKAEKSNFEVLQNQQIKEASRQAETRKKQDERLNNAVRRQVIVEAQDNALKNAINILIDRTLGAGASKKPEVAEKFEDILSQSGTYIVDQKYTGELDDNNYVAKVSLTVDETEFRTLISDMGIAINTQTVRAHSIMLVLDEFFARPSDLNNNIVTKEVTTYKYDRDTKETDKEALKAASSSKYAAANSYAKAGASSKSGVSYGHFYDYKDKESAFFQNIKEYDVASPKAQNLNYTQTALQDAFTVYDIRALDNDVFKSKYFKGKAITSDRLSNSAELANYVEAARKDAKADFFAIGVSYIVDTGKNPHTGMNTCDGNVFVKVYSTTDSEVIASGSFTETASGNSADQARTAVAQKIGNELGEVLSKRIQDYWKKRMMYGSEYIVQVRGNFIPAERIMIRQAIERTNGVKNVVQRAADSTNIEYTVNYSGQNSVGDEIYMNLYNSSLSGKIKNYDYKIKGNQIIFLPLSQKGRQDL